MNESDLRRIGDTLKLKLPMAYQETVLNYPFPRESCANDFLLPSDLAQVLDLNNGSPTVSGVVKPFFVGSDGGEELYFLNSDMPNSPVYVLDLETGKHSVKAQNWPEFLTQIRADLASGAADEASEKERRSRKRWWQFWE
jgi:hypothetical protein